MNYNSFFKILRWMRNHKKLVIFVITIILIAILASCGMVTSTATMAIAGMVIPGTDDGRHVVDGPLTTELSREGSHDLLLNEIDQQIVKIRPMSTPIDQISRHAGSKHAGSMVVDFYRVDTKPTSAQLQEDVLETEAGDVEEPPIVTIHTSNDEIFDATDTILVQGVSGYQADGVTQSGQDLMLYVMERNSNGLNVMAVNGPTVGGVTGCFPNIPHSTVLVRMGRAASELDVQSPQFEALPTKGRNLCQIFKGI